MNISYYNTNNFSKISLLFYGTYINSTICKACKQILYDFQKFEFISFQTHFYHKIKFNIFDGFKDNSKPYLSNNYFCSICNKNQEAETTCEIFEPPQKLLIYIDYGKNQIYQPKCVEFEEEIDITRFVAFDYKLKFNYKISVVCTYVGNNQYSAFCRHREKNVWYEFNDSSVRECNRNEIYRRNPYLLLYERIFE